MMRRMIAGSTVVPADGRRKTSGRATKGTPKGKAAGKKAAKRRSVPKGTTRGPKVVCIGEAAVDLIFQGVRLPELGTSTASSEFDMYPGGTAANVAIALSKLEVPTLLLYPKPPEDNRLGGILAELLAGAAKSEYLDLAPIEDPRGQASTSAVLVSPDPDKERTFVHHSGRNRNWKLRRIQQTLSDLHKEGVIDDGGKIIFFGGLGNGRDFTADPTAGKALLTWIRETLVMKVAADVVPVQRIGTEAWRTAMSGVWKYIDYFMPNQEEVAQICPEGDPFEYLRGKALRHLLVKRGATGVTVYPGGAELPPRTDMLDAAVDTTGAGDTWCAGFLAHLVNTDFADFYTAARFANVAASFCITSVGATTGVPAYGVVRDRMAEWYGDS